MRKANLLKKKNSEHLWWKTLIHCGFLSLIQFWNINSCGGREMGKAHRVFPWPGQFQRRCCSVRRHERNAFRSLSRGLRAYLNSSMELSECWNDGTNKACCLLMLPAVSYKYHHLYEIVLEYHTWILWTSLTIDCQDGLETDNTGVLSLISYSMY